MAKKPPRPKAKKAVDLGRFGSNVDDIRPAARRDARTARTARGATRAAARRALITESGCKRIVHASLRVTGKFRPEVTPAQRDAQKMSDLSGRATPRVTPTSPKQKYAEILVYTWNMWGLRLESPLGILRDDAKTVEDLRGFCFANQS